MLDPDLDEMTADPQPSSHFRENVFRKVFHIQRSLLFAIEIKKKNIEAYSISGEFTVFSHIGEKCIGSYFLPT